MVQNAGCWLLESWHSVRMSEGNLPCFTDLVITDRALGLFSYSYASSGFHAFLTHNDNRDKRATWLLEATALDLLCAKLLYLQASLSI